MDHLAELVMTDPHRNPSYYAMVVVSEGSTIEGGDIIGDVAEDAYDHLKLGGIGQHMANVLAQKIGVSTINQQQAYSMRVGPLDSLDRMLATIFANLAM
jgi:6-phosphofructokinase 1